MDIPTNLEDLKRVELQKLCKSHGIKANMKVYFCIYVMCVCNVQFSRWSASVCLCASLWVGVMYMYNFVDGVCVCIYIHVYAYM